MTEINEKCSLLYKLLQSVLAAVKEYKHKRNLHVKKAAREEKLIIARETPTQTIRKFRNTFHYNNISFIWIPLDTNTLRSLQ